jgi:hypothetical protein
MLLLPKQVQELLLPTLIASSIARVAYSWAGLNVLAAPALALLSVLPAAILAYNVLVGAYAAKRQNEFARFVLGYLVLSVATPLLRVALGGSHAVLSLLDQVRTCTLLAAVTDRLRIPVSAVAAIALFGALDLATGEEALNAYYLPGKYLVSTCYSAACRLSGRRHCTTCVPDTPFPLSRPASLCSPRHWSSRL